MDLARYYQFCGFDEQAMRLYLNERDELTFFDEYNLHVLYSKNIAKNNQFSLNILPSLIGNSDPNKSQILLMDYNNIYNKFDKKGQYAFLPIYNQKAYNDLRVVLHSNTELKIKAQFTSSKSKGARTLTSSNKLYQYSVKSIYDSTVKVKCSLIGKRPKNDRQKGASNSDTRGEYIVMSIYRNFGGKFEKIDQYWMT